MAGLSARQNRMKSGTPQTNPLYFELLKLIYGHDTIDILL